MKAPQIIYVSLLLVNIGVALAKHGEPTGEKHNFFIRLFSAGLSIALLVRGGSAYFGIIMNGIETWQFCMAVPAKLMCVVGNIYDIKAGD